MSVLRPKYPYRRPLKKEHQSIRQQRDLWMQNNQVRSSFTLSDPDCDKPGPRDTLRPFL